MSDSDGSKTIYLKIRDDVLNVSSQASATTSLDTTLPVANVVTGPDVTKISKVATKDTATFTWKADSKIVAYEVRVVPASDSPHDAGSVIGTTNGSTNTSGSTVINADTNYGIARLGYGDKQLGSLPMAFSASTRAQCAFNQCFTRISYTPLNLRV